MKTLLLALICVLLAGCQNSTVSIGQASFKRYSFLYPLKISSMKFTLTDTNNTKSTVDIKGYTTDQAELLGQIAEGVAKGAIQGAK